MSDRQVMYFAIFLTLVITSVSYLLYRIHTYVPGRPVRRPAPRPTPLPRWRRARTSRRVRTVVLSVLAWVTVTAVLSVVSSPTAAVWGGGAVLPLAVAAITRAFDPGTVTDTEWDHALADLITR